MTDSQQNPDNTNGKIVKSINGNALRTVMGMEANLGGFNPNESALPPGHPLLTIEKNQSNLPEANKKVKAELPKKQDDDESITVIKNRISKINNELEKVLVTLIAQSEEIDNVFEKLSEFPSVFSKAKKLKQVLGSCHMAIRTSLIKPYLGK